MNHPDEVTKSSLSSLELGMQELEAMEAPGWWTGIGISVGAVVTYVSVYTVTSGIVLT